jgi:hypothetical protein
MKFTIGPRRNNDSDVGDTGYSQETPFDLCDINTLAANFIGGVLSPGELDEAVRVDECQIFAAKDVRAIEILDEIFGRHFWVPPIARSEILEAGRDRANGSGRALVSVLVDNAQVNTVKRPPNREPSYSDDGILRERHIGHTAELRHPHRVHKEGIREMLSYLFEIVASRGIGAQSDQPNVWEARTVTYALHEMPK